MLFGVNTNHSFLVKKIAYRTVSTQVAAVRGKNMTDFADCSIIVIGGYLNKVSNAARAVAFVGGIFVPAVSFIQLAGSLLNGTRDIIFRYVVALSIINRRVKSGIHIRIAASFTSSQDRKSTRLNSSHASISYAV